MEEIQIKTSSRACLVDITDRLQTVVSKCRVKDGVCFVFVPHTTAGVTINENADPSVAKDINGALSRLVPADAGYAHTEGNSDAHIKSSIVGSSLTIFTRNFVPPKAGLRTFLTKFQWLGKCFSCPPCFVFEENKGGILSHTIENGRLALGTWQGIYFVEGDGPRGRQVWVKIR